MEPMAAGDDANVMLRVSNTPSSRRPFFFHSNPEVRGMSKQNTSDLWGFGPTVCHVIPLVAVRKCKKMGGLFLWLYI